MDHAVAFTICVPDVAVEVDCSTWWIARLAGRRGEEFTNNLARLRIDLDDRALGRNGDPDKVEVSRVTIELKLICDVVNDVEGIAFIKVSVERVSAFGEWLRLDDDR